MAALLPNFARPYFSVTSNPPQCATCAAILKHEDYCGACGYRQCSVPTCRAAHEKIHTHDAEACQRSRLDNLERDLIGFLTFKEDMKGASSMSITDKRRLNAMLTAMYVQILVRDYAPDDDPVKTTKYIQQLRTVGVPRLPTDLQSILVAMWPQPNSSFAPLMYQLFAAFLFYHDDSHETLVQCLLGTFYMHVLHSLNVGIQTLPDTHEDKRDAPTANTVNIVVNPMDNMTNAREPLIKSLISSRAEYARPGAVFAVLLQRPVINSLILVDLICMDTAESLFFQQEGPKPAVVRSQILLMRIEKTRDSDLAMRVIQSHGDFYSIGQWLEANIPASQVDGVTVDPSPVAAKRIQGMIEVRHFVKALDDLVNPANSAEKRRDAYAIVTGVHFRDAAAVAPFHVSMLEANLTH